ncbi:Gfo/Idh/MocA family oxidoreductase [Arthrobacter sp. NtRootA1]|uniref:Gfo/Idh/MocA family protein n=1 Tax=Arthrobacter sp. NtRootA1 TaxID=2830983 RepID=UPI001CC45FC4|nr:Gfo/Idh/MocA family oxidoreductase [Arthrobacter sp. NtRootA1]BCW08032.1 oxidoreductase [Arthrobacter sp. NtRootA1]
MKSALILGFGWAARELWVPALATAGFGTFGVIDQHADMAAVTGKQIRRHENVSGISSSAYDVAVVASPNATHSAVAAELLERGLRVVVEKPICVSVDEFKLLQQAASNGGGELLRSCSSRYDPHLVEFREHLQEVGLSKPTYVKVSWLRENGIPNSPWHTQSQHAVAGSCLDLGWHLLESVMELVGYAPLQCLDAQFDCDPGTQGAGRASWHRSDLQISSIDVDTMSEISFTNENGVSVELRTAWRSTMSGDRVTIEVGDSTGFGRLTTLFGLSQSLSQVPNIESSVRGRKFLKELPPKARGVAHARMVTDFVNGHFLPANLGQSWEQLESLAGAAQQIVASHEVWRSSRVWGRK